MRPADASYLHSGHTKKGNQKCRLCEFPCTENNYIYLQWYHISFVESCYFFSIQFPIISHQVVPVVGQITRAVINTYNDVKYPLLWEFSIYNVYRRILGRVLVVNIVNIRNEWPFSGFVGNISECGTNKSSENRFATRIHERIHETRARNLPKKSSIRIISREVPWTFKMVDIPQKLQGSNYRIIKIRRPSMAPPKNTFITGFTPPPTAR